MGEPVRGNLVCFMSAFTGGLTITHAVLSGAEKTLCGRGNWYTKEGLLYDDDKERWDFVVLTSPDCLKCAKALRKLRANATAEEVKEAKRGLPEG